MWDAHEVTVGVGLADFVGLYSMLEDNELIKTIIM